MGLPYNVVCTGAPNPELHKEMMTMATILLGAALTLGLFLALYLVFRYKGDSGNPSKPGSYFSTYDGGHDGLSQQGGNWGGREVSHADGGGDGDSGGDGGGGDGGGGQ
jgi:hypothetical protein